MNRARRIGAAVIAIIVRSAWKLMRSTLERDVALWLIFLVSAVVTAWSIIRAAANWNPGSVPAGIEACRTRGGVPEGKRTRAWSSARSW